MVVQFTIPPNTLTRIAFTFGSKKLIISKIHYIYICMKQ